MVWRLWYAFSVQKGVVNRRNKANEEVVVVVVVVVITMSHCGQNVRSCFINSKLKQWLVATVCFSNPEGSATSS
jgi:hypothetical protein